MSWSHSRRQTMRCSLSVLALLASMIGCGAKQQAQPAATAATASQTPPPAGELAALPEQARCGPVSAHFGFDDSELSPSARDALANYQRCIQHLGVERVQVRGMTDPRGTEEYNLALGERRASATAKYLTALGLAQADPSSVGEELAQGADEASWANDRRADVTAP